MTPAFVDPHTHIMPPSDRSDEFGMRSTKSYLEIAKEGGGIQASVKACREGTLEQILAVNEANIRRFLYHGTLTLEMKSGYGLDLDTEIKLLEVAKKLKIKYTK